MPGALAAGPALLRLLQRRMQLGAKAAVHTHCVCQAVAQLVDLVLEAAHRRLPVRQVALHILQKGGWVGGWGEGLKGRGRRAGGTWGKGQGTMHLRWAYMFL